MRCLPESTYWEGFWRRRLSRRRLLAGTALAGSGLLAASAFGCRAGTPASTPRASPSQTGGDNGHVPVSENGRGGTLQLPGFEAFISDTLDPHQTQFGPIYSSHSSVFSKVLRYEDPSAGTITTDLATTVPESVDGREFIIKLRQGVHFQRPSQALGHSPSAQEKAIDGRELTAEDVVFSFQRQSNRASPRRRYYFRSYQYEAIERLEAVDPHTVRMVMKEPLALALHYLADTNAFIVPKEAVDASDQMNSQEAMIGTGPFMWDHLQPLQEATFVRNPDWFGWGQPQMARPYIDGYRSVFLANDAPLEATFRQRQMDAALQVNNPGWVRGVRDDFPEVLARDVGFSAWINTRLLVDRPPYNDIRVRRAIHLALDRQQMIDAMFAGSGHMQGPLSPVLSRWALPPEELATLPGYRTERSLREQDIRDARQMYVAAGSPDLRLTAADQPEYVPAFASQIQRALEDNLGAKVKVNIRGYLQIGEGLVRGDMPFTWQYDNGWIDPDDWLYPFFHTDGTHNTFRLSDPQLDSMLEAQRRAFDFEHRQQMIRDIQRYLLDNVLARLDWVTPVNQWIAWPYYRNFAPTPFFGESYLLSESWIDRDDPSYEKRTT